MAIDFCNSFYLPPLPPISTARDIVKYLGDKRVASVDDFNWVAQLRYYWRYDEVGKCFRCVRQFLYVLVDSPRVGKGADKC